MNINWIGGSGDWYDSNNWDVGKVPSSEDNVTIEIDGGEAIVTFSQGEPTVNSLSLFSRNGGVLRLPDLTSYTGSEIQNTTIEANGSGSEIDLSGVTKLTGISWLNATSILTQNGGKIDLSQVTEITGGATDVSAEGSNSSIDFSSLQSWKDDYYQHSDLTAIDGGTVSIENLTEVEGVHITVNDSGNLATSQIESLINEATITVDGIPADFNNLSNIDGSNLLVFNGGSLSLPLVTSYTTDDNSDNTIEADGLGSSIDLSNVTTIQRPPDNPSWYEVTINAKNDADINLSAVTILDGDYTFQSVDGGQMELTGIEQIDGGLLTVLADGKNSLIELSDLSTILGWLPEERNGGEILVAGEPLENLPVSIQGGELAEDTVWSGIVGVVDTVTVPAGVSLTVEPGTIIKFKDNEFVGLDVRGTLDVEAGLENRVIFTSWKDDTAGGDNNGDGNNSTPEIADWQGIIVSGSEASATLKNVEIRHSDKAIEGVDSATINLDNSILSQNNYGVYVYDPFVEVTAENCLISDNAFSGVFVRADSREIFRNCTIVKNGFSGAFWDAAGIHLGGADLTLENTIVAFNQNGLDHSTNADPPLLNVSHSLFYNPDGEEVIWSGNSQEDINQLYLDENGNLNLDPLFVDRTQGNYQLSSGSPAIDAGLGTNAPTQDLLGQSRHDDSGIANTGSGDPNYVDLGVYESQTDSVAADLSVTEVADPSPQSVNVGDEITTSWTVTNIGGNTANSPWTDSVYLSNDPYPSSDDLLLETREHTTPLAGGDSYTETVTVTIPSTAGNQYIVVASDRNQTLVETDEYNNIATASQTLNVVAPVLSVGTPVTGTVTQNGWTFYQFSVTEPGQTIQLELDGETESGGLALYTQYGKVPTLTDYEGIAALTYQPDQEIRILAPRAGTYYIGVYGQYLPAEFTDFTLSAEPTSFDLYSVNQPSVANGSSVTVELEGDNLSTDDWVYLVAPDNSTQVNSTAIFNPDSTRTYATFNLEEVEPGVYDVVVENTESDVASLTDSLTIVSEDDTQPDEEFYANMILPGMARPGRRVNITLEYGNRGRTDITSPIFELTSDDDMEWQIPGTEEWITGSSLEFIAPSSDGAPNILRPGQEESIVITARTPFREGDIPVTLSASGIGEDAENTPIDWDALAADIPASINSEAWETIISNLATQTGDTWGDYQAMLNDNTAYLQQLGQTVSNPSQLLSFELLQANGWNPSGYLAASEDAFESAPGLSLSLTRVYGNGIESRYNLGAFGRGWTHNYDVSLTQLEDGTYEKPPGFNGTLTENDDGSFKLQEETGIVYGFNANGRLVKITDPNNNEISVTYTDGNLTQLTHSSGQILQLEYNSSGRIVKITDNSGRQTIYEYDESGEHLTQVTTPNGVTSYEYSTGENPATENALLSITYPGGEELLYTYDSQGRLASESLNGDVGRITYSYDSAGTVTATDATGASMQFFFDWRGIPVQIVDPLGHVSQVQLDADGNITQLIRPTGLSSQFTYDDLGNVTQITDPSGITTAFGYDSNFNNLQWVRDGRQNTLTYNYDATGSLASIVYPDSSAETFEVDSQGNLVEYANRRGDAIQYTYNADGLPVRKEYEDGSEVEFAYDNRDNLISVTDDNGTIEMVYDSTDQLTQINYPDGRSLQYTYDNAGRRTQMLDQDGFTVNYAYNSVGQLTNLTNQNGENIVSYTYDNAGLLVREDNGNGTATTYEYDAAGQLLHVINLAPDNSVNSRFDYTYDELGRRTTMTTLEGTWQYGYDANSQLTSVQLPDGRTINYQYDAAGNRITVTENGEATSYSTNNLNQYTAVGDATYTYDADGNLVAKTEEGQTSTYTYDVENRLIGVVTPEGNWSYEYDALGNRTAVIQDGERIEYLVDPFGFGDVVGEYDANGNPVARYIHGIGLESRVDANNAKSFYDFDALGSTAGLSDANGDYLNHYSYLPFGEDLTKVETVPNSFEYVGEWGVMDEGNGLDFMRNRYYSPELGRFTAVDAIGLSGGDTNLYRSVGNSPLTLVDPIGLDPKSLWFEHIVKAAKKVEIWAEQRSWESSKIVAEYPGQSYLKAYRIYQYGQTGLAARDLYQIYQQKNYPGNRNIDIARKFVDIGESVGSATLPFTPYSLPGNYGLASNPLAFFTHLLRRAIDLWEDAANAVKDILQTEDSANDLKVIQTEAIRNNTSKTPEDKFGPLGYDNPETPTEEKQRFVLPDQTFNYRIDFWNKPDAEVPTQDAVIVDTLDSDLDWSTLSFTNIGFLDWDIDLPGGQAVDTRVDLRPTMNLAVDVEATFNPETGEIRWWFHAVDPVTGESPDDPMAGFLPPFNEETQYELGWVEFTVEPKEGLPTNTEIENQAFVQFDFLGPFNPAPKPDPWLNTIDATPPNSSVEPLPETVMAFTYSFFGEFPVSWSGTDEGSGIASYDIYVSVDRGPFELWLDDTTETAANYIGEIGRSYSFYSVATDGVGLTQTVPSQAQASTMVLESAKPGVTITPTEGLTTSEDGETAEFTVVLDSQPGSDVVISLDSLNPEEGTIAPSQLTFTMDNWNQPQTVTVTGVDDSRVDGNIDYAIRLTVASDPMYNDTPVPDLIISNLDNETVDMAGITVNPTEGLTTSEDGETAEFTVTLDSQPTADVVISINSENPGEGTIALSQLTFTSDNWNQPQTVTITGVDDSQVDGNIDYLIQLTVASEDPIYDAIAVPDISMTNIDDDVAGITVDPTDGLITSEDGETAEFTVILDSQPTADVAISIDSSNPGEGTIAPSQITFTIDNWNQSQTVTVTGFYDGTIDGDRNYNAILNPAESEDANYNGMNPEDVAIVNLDNGLVPPPSTIPEPEPEPIPPIEPTPEPEPAPPGIGDRVISGTFHSDELMGTDESEVMEGYAGNDVIFGLRSADNLFGHADRDLLFGNQGGDFLDGNEDNDTLYGGQHGDTLMGHDGQDILFGNHHGDYLDGGDENDFENGNQFADTVNGGGGDDTLYGGQQNDILNGGIGNDRLFGDKGDDTLIGVETHSNTPGQNEVDTLEGGEGSDIFVLGNSAYSFYVGNLGLDCAIISDFDPEFDRLQLSGGRGNYILIEGSEDARVSYLYRLTAEGEDLIAIVQNQSDLSLNDNYFEFVSI